MARTNNGKMTAYQRQLLAAIALPAPGVMNGVVQAADAGTVERQLRELQEECTVLKARVAQLEEQLTEADAAVTLTREALLQPGRIDLSKLPSLASPKVHIELQGFDRNLPAGGVKIIRLQAERFNYEFTLPITVIQSSTAASEFAMAAEVAATKLADEIRRSVRDGLINYGKQIIKADDFVPPPVKPAVFKPFRGKVQY